VAPDDLYRDGLNRQLFLPFITLLKRNTQVMALESPTDYRLEKLNSMPVYLTPLSPDTDRQMDEAWAVVTHGRPGAPETVEVKGRQVAVPRASGEAARFSFADLCEKPLAAREYLAIAARYATVFIDHVPMLAEGKRNEAKRFILLVDTLYDKHCRLFISAEAPPAHLYLGKRGTEAFEFERTVSRLAEMQGREWLQHWADRGAARPQPADAREAPVR
jgi:cell division protein ZapE